MLESPKLWHCHQLVPEQGEPEDWHSVFDFESDEEGADQEEEQWLSSFMRRQLAHAVVEEEKRSLQSTVFNGVDHASHLFISRL